MTDEFMRRNAIGKANHVRVLWREGCNSLMAQEGDLFSLAGEGAPTRRIVVIPVDTGFCTRLQNSLEAQEPGLVSENTLHGKFLIRMESSGVDSSELEMRIASNLSKQGLACPGERGEGRSFPIGTVAVIDEADASYFLLAVSTLDVKGGAFSCEEDVRLAMRKLIAFYDRNGQGYSMFVPLVGTGRSRAHLSFSKSCELISEVFIDNSEHIQGDVRIVMLPQAWQEVFSSWGGDGDDAL